MNENPNNNRSWSDDERVVKRALQQHLDKEVGNLDFNVTSKLAAARHRALDQAAVSTTPGKVRDWTNWPAIAGGAVVLGLTLILGTQLYSPDTSTNTNHSTVAHSDLMEDLPLLTASDDLEFYQSIEFLEWMESNSG